MQIRGENDRTLGGFTVGVTADRRWEEQAALLTRRGATVVHGPSIRTVQLGESDELLRVTRELVANPPTHVLANTGIGMRSWLAAAESWELDGALRQRLAEATIVARGPKAAAAVHQAGLDVAARSMSERLVETVDLLLALGVRGARVAFQRHGDDAPEVGAALEAAGATVIEVPVYRWTIPDDTSAAERLITATIDGAIHGLTFTSAPAFDNLLAIADDMDAGAALRETLIAGRTVVCCVGPVCAQAALRIGVVEPLVPERFRLGPMIRTLESGLERTKRATTLRGIPVTLAGRSASVGGRDVALTGREEALLRHLMDRVGSVVAKRDLLQTVWAGEGDEHTVEVAVGRLRRQLGSAGDGVETVRKRGYRLVP
jgi:uroporphyrinogen-III synthase